MQTGLIILLYDILLHKTTDTFFNGNISSTSPPVTLYTVIEYTITANATHRYDEFHWWTLWFVSNVYTGRIQKRNCSESMFRPNATIGYGKCTSRGFLPQMNMTELCIYSGYLGIGSQSVFQFLNSFEIAVNASLNSNIYPIQQPNFVPDLPIPLNCYDSAQPTTYGMCNGNSGWYGYSQATCNAYFASNICLCRIGYDLLYRTTEALGYSHEETFSELNYLVIAGVRFQTTNAFGLSYKYFESATQVLYAEPRVSSNNISYHFCFCYCTTPMCNVNISTCTAGLGFDCLSSIYYSNANTTTMATTSLMPSTSSTAFTSSLMTSNGFGVTGAMTSVQDQRLMIGLIVGTVVAGILLLLGCIGFIMIWTGKCYRRSNTNTVTLEETSYEHGNEKTDYFVHDQLPHIAVRTNRAVELRKKILQHS